MNKVAIYARVSTKNQDEAQQIPAIAEYFKLTDYELYKEEVSAWNIDKESKRAEFLRLISDIKSKKISKLYIWHIDRLYRNRLKTREFMNLCLHYDVAVYSLHQSWLNDFQQMKEKMPDSYKFMVDDMYSIMLNVYAQTAEDESKTKSERVKLKIKKDKQGITRSVFGRKWGRKALPKRVADEVFMHHNNGKSMRWIANNVYYYDKNKNKKTLSVGSVHKIICAIKPLSNT